MDSKPKLEDIESAAAAWLVRRDKPDWSAADEAGLDAWLEASASHRVAYIRQVTTWRDADRLKSLSAGFPKGQVPPRGTIERSPYFTIRRGERGEDEPMPAPESQSVAGTQPRAAPRRRLRAYSVAAAVLVAVMLGVIVATQDFLTGTLSFNTPIGGLSSFPIADGSTITLNTDSKIKVRLTQTERRIELGRGEAFFDVAKDPLRPFVVYAHNQRVIAVGTKFSVRLGAKAVQVAVTEGKVRLEERPAAKGSTMAQLAVAGNVADIDGHHITVKQRSLPEIEQVLSWRSGNVVLDHTPLPDAVAEFNRYNMRQLVIADPGLTDIAVGGNFRATNVDGFVRLVQQAFAVDAKAEGDKIVLTRKR